jgi:hypothetical protein
VISWGVELTDKVSAPANASAAAMGRAAQQAKVMTDAVHGLHGPLGEIPSALDEVKEHSESMFTEFFKAEFAVELVKKLGEAVFDLGKEMFTMAIEAGENVEKLTSVFQALSGGVEGAGTATLAMLRDLEKEIPQSEKQVSAWARGLMAAGVTDMSKLRESLKAIAGAESLVEGGGERVKSILEKLNEASIKGTKIKFSVASLAGTGLTEEDVMKQLGMTPKQLELAKKHGTITGTQIADAMVKALAEKSAGLLEAQMNEIGTMATKAKDSIMRLFEGVNIKPFSDGLKECHHRRVRCDLRRGRYGVRVPEGCVSSPRHLVSRSGDLPQADRPRLP